MDMNEWRKNRYRVFDEHIDAMKEHPKYDWLRKYADEAKMNNEGGGYSMIVAADFIMRIEENPVENIRAWLNSERPLFHRDSPEFKEGK